MAFQKQVKWPIFKSFVNSKDLSIQYLDYGSEYSLQAFDGYFTLECVLDKNPSDTTDLLDFENNYKTNGNKILSQQNQAFASKTLPNGKKLFKREHGIQANVIQGSNTIIFTIPYPWVKLDGVEILNGTILDYCDFYVLDSVTGNYSTIPNYQLNQFGYTTNIRSNYYISESKYDADLYQGMQLKVVYNSVDTKTIGINLKLNEVKS